tara:strand:- start:4647 stop:4847 length:201 start_codon:yes stop_codon:yes gene_type:complete
MVEFAINYRATLAAHRRDCGHLTANKNDPPAGIIRKRAGELLTCVLILEAARCRKCLLCREGQALG